MVKNKLIGRLWRYTRGGEGKHYHEPAKEICNALLDHAVKQDEQLRQNSAVDMIDDKTVFIVKRT